VDLDIKKELGDSAELIATDLRRKLSSEEFQWQVR
jgi:hypothetical protein